MKQAMHEKNINTVAKRDKRTEPFSKDKIVSSVATVLTQTGEGTLEDAVGVVSNVIRELENVHPDIIQDNFIPTTHLISDLICNELNQKQFFTAAQVYKQCEACKKRQATEVDERVQRLAREGKKYFRNALGEFVYYRTYARWIEAERRRETWIETVDRYMNFMHENLGAKLTDDEYAELRRAIIHQEVVPSMRLLQFAGDAVRKTNVCAYNCSFLAPAALDDFAEIMYILMCGSGAGFSVERAHVEQLPIVKNQTGTMLPVYVVDDSREGWCDALKHGLHAWFDGYDVPFDFSQLRPAGARLKTMGGKSSGPEPLKNLLIFARTKILNRQGQKLSPLDVHDILCMIGKVVVSGGVRRSAMISLSDLDECDLRDAKKGAFWEKEPQRHLANNSAVYNQKPSVEEFLEEWLALVKSGTGERGIFNRGGLKNTLPQRRAYKDFLGTNPCGEIILRSKQFCNLSEVIARADDTTESLVRKIRLATILGTYQSTLTNFGYLSEDWKKNCEEERLLGVSITGQWDCVAVRNREALALLRVEAEKTNREYAQRFGINASAAITCVKPSGTVSKAFDTASGMHQRHARYYIQRIRISATDALFKMLKEQGVPYHPEVGQTMETADTFVLEFPVKSPDGAVLKNDLCAIEQLEYWKMVKEYYTDHNPSVTITIDEHEWLEVAYWVYQHWDIIGGLSFLPKSKHIYKLAPYEEIDEQKYNELIQKVGHIDFSRIVTYERNDETDVKVEAACFAGSCEI